MTICVKLFHRENFVIPIILCFAAGEGVWGSKDFYSTPEKRAILSHYSCSEGKGCQKTVAK